LSDEDTKTLQNSNLTNSSIIGQIQNNYIKGLKVKNERERKGESNNSSYSNDLVENTIVTMNV